MSFSAVAMKAALRFDYEHRMCDPSKNTNVKQRIAAHFSKDFHFRFSPREPAFSFKH